MARILVPFHGAGSGVGELTWGQQGIWRTIDRQGFSEFMGGVVALSDGATVEQVAATLRFAVSRHQSLRTRLRFDPDGRPRQVLASSGEVPLDVVDADGDADPAEVALALRERWQHTAFDYAAEWPVRMAVVRRGGRPTHAVAVYCHLALDAHGLDVLLADLVTMDRGTGESSAPVAGVQPLELARQQREPATLRQGEASIRYWERLLRTIPPRRFGESTDKRTPRYWEIGYTSPATLRAMRALAAREGVDTSPVLLAGFAAALAAVVGNNPVVTQLAVNNRFRPGLAQTVSPVAQTTLCVVDVADVTFTEAVMRAQRAAMSAYKYAYYDPERRLDLFVEVGRDRGEEVDVACYFNDRRQQVRGPAGPVPDPEQIRAAAALGRVRWQEQTDEPGARLYLDVDETPDAVDFTMSADTHCLSPADMEAVVRRIEATVVTAALDPAAGTGVHSARVAVP